MASTTGVGSRSGDGGPVAGPTASTATPTPAPTPTPATTPLPPTASTLPSSAAGAALVSVSDQLPTFYRTVDPIQNLVVHVRIEKLNTRHGRSRNRSGAASVSAPTPGTTPGVGDAEDGMEESKATSTPRPDTGSVIGVDGALEGKFKWQEKVFSPREVAKYDAMLRAKAEGRRAGPSETYIDADYMARLEAAKVEHPDLHRDLHSVMLFTYVDQDGYVPPSETGKSLLVRDTGPQSELADAISRLPMRTANSLTTGSRPLSHVRREAPFRTMYVMAAVDIDKEAFRADDPAAKMTEIPLCAIKVYTSTNLLEMRPGFYDPDVEIEEEEVIPAPDGDPTSVAQPERFSTKFRTASGDVYGVTLTNPDQSAEFNRLLDSEREAEAKAVAMTANRVGSEFYGIPLGPAVTRVFAFVEVVAAAGFVPPELFVEYEVRLPSDSGWRWANEFMGDAKPPVSGVTQVSASRARVWQWDVEDGTVGAAGAAEERVMDVAHFAYPIELHLKNTPALSSVPPSQAPEILFSIFSRDTWGRTGVAGYTSLTLPTAPGSHSLTLHAWRPSGTIREKLADFFLGGASRLTDAADASIPRSVDRRGVTKLNKFGLKTETTGHLAVRVNVVSQKRPPYLASSGKDRKNRKTIAQIIAEAKAVRKLLKAKDRAGAKIRRRRRSSAAAAAAAAAVTKDDDDDEDQEDTTLSSGLGTPV